MTFDFTIVPLAKKHDRQGFDCGEASLNLFLTNYARQNSEKGLGKTFVATRPDSSKVCGYYTLSSGSIDFDDVPEKLPRYPVPTAHLGRLAVDVSCHGLGLGELLLIDAFRRVMLVAEELGIYALEVYALNSSARNFYLKYEFISLKDDEFHLYLPLKSIRKLVQI